MREFDLEAVCARLNRLSGGTWIPGYLVEKYTEGDCWELAVGLCRRFGWPVSIMHDVPWSMYVRGESYGCNHALVRSPIGYVDIMGVWTQRQIKDQWRPAIGNRVYMTELPVGWVGASGHFKRNWSAHAHLRLGSITTRVIDSLKPQLVEMGAL